MSVSVTEVEGTPEPDYNGSEPQLSHIKAHVTGDKSIPPCLISEIKIITILPRRAVVKIK